MNIYVVSFKQQRKCWCQIKADLERIRDSESRIFKSLLWFWNMQGSIIAACLMYFWAPSTKSIPCTSSHKPIYALCVLIDTFHKRTDIACLPCRGFHADARKMLLSFQCLLLIFILRWSVHMRWPALFNHIPLRAFCCHRGGLTSSAAHTSLVIIVWSSLSTLLLRQAPIHFT